MLSALLSVVIVSTPAEVGQFHLAPKRKQHNTLSADEKKQGFELLFDGKSLDKFRAFNRPDVPKGWVAKDGEITFTPGDEGGDLMTREQYTDFDLRLEFKMSEHGNSGIIYMVNEDAKASWHTGPEYQLLDDPSYDISDLHKTGANYALHVPENKKMNPHGQWNEARVVKKGANVKHYLNGNLIVEYELWSDDWAKRRDASKFKDIPEYCKHDRGYICLQDHGGLIWFRNLRIRKL